MSLTVLTRSLPPSVQNTFSLRLPSGYRILSVLHWDRGGGSRIYILADPDQPPETVDFFMCSTGSTIYGHGLANLEHVATWELHVGRCIDRDTFDGFVWHLFKVIGTSEDDQ